MSYTPPFTITTEILNLVANISERVGLQTANAFDVSPQLRKQNRIKTIAGTLAIEGNTLTEEQITAIVDGQRVLGSVRELAEVKGAIAAYDALPSFQPEKIEDLLTAHGLMTSDILTNAGKFRTRALGIHKGKKVSHLAPPARRVPGLMEDLSDWLKRTDAHSLIAGSVFHYELEFIHPFTDGNGRMGRLWQTLILSKWHPLFLSLPLESLIKDNQQGYYEALEQSDKQAQSTPFIRFILSVIAETLTQNAPVNASLNAPVNALANAPVNLAGLNTPEAIVALVERNPEITRQTMAEIIEKDLRTVSRAIAKLRREGKLRRIGSDKKGRWEIK